GRCWHLPALWKCSASLPRVTKSRRTRREDFARRDADSVRLSACRRWWHFHARVAAAPRARPQATVSRLSTIARLTRREIRLVRRCQKQFAHPRFPPHPFARRRRSKPWKSPALVLSPLFGNAVSNRSSLAIRGSDESARRC